MSTRRLRSSTLRLHVPWEVLLGVCQQADEPTLKKLCLVSFGMLQLAGPLLYEEVEIRTLKRLKAFFVLPSIIPSPSRLRPQLGVARLKRLSLDFQPRTGEPALETIADVFPSSTWDPPVRRRLHPASPVSISFLSTKVATETDQSEALMKLLTKHISAYLPPRRRAFFLSLRQPRTIFSKTINFSFRKTYDSPLAVQISGMTDADLDMGQDLILDTREGHEEMEPSPPTSVTSTLDLRRLVLKSLVDPLHLELVIETMLAEEGRWAGCPEVVVDFLVASEEVRSKVDEVLAEWSQEERRTQTRVTFEKSEPAVPLASSS